jgi:hypothetical protein
VRGVGVNVGGASFGVGVGAWIIGVGRSPTPATAAGRAVVAVVEDPRHRGRSREGSNFVF